MVASPLSMYSPEAKPGSAKKNKLAKNAVIFFMMFLLYFKASFRNLLLSPFASTSSRAILTANSTMRDFATLDL